MIETSAHHTLGQFLLRRIADCYDGQMHIGLDIIVLSRPR